MYLKKLSVQGFKSFANRTTFDFSHGVTTVVGPNGSGKSNVTDAIRWVLGEQSARLLRAKKQDDVIFSGARDRKAVGMAEVLLTLDNEDRWLPLDFAEVEIGRRVYRSGESEYLLNGARVRLRDISDLLMKGDVGQNSYTIMGQGLVDEVLSMNADERRVFLDEAADVKRFRMRIKEAQDRLAATRENLARVDVVISEIEPRLSQLSRQAERATEHSKLSQELGDLLRMYYGQRWHEAQNNLTRARAALDQSSAEDGTALERVEQVREQLKTLSEEIRRRRETIARKEARSTELDQRLKATEQAIALDRERLSMVHGRRGELAREIEQLEAEQESLGQVDLNEGRRGAEIAGEVEKAREEATAARQALDLAERDYTAIRSRLQEIRDGAEADERRARALEQEAEGSERRFMDLEREAQNHLMRRKTLLMDLSGYGRRFAELRAVLVEAQSGLDEVQATSEQARGRLRRVRDEVRVYEDTNKTELRELDQLEGRLDALRRVHAEHDGVAVGTRAVLLMGQALIDGIAPGSLGEPPEIAGIVGLLSRQIRVPPGLEFAISAALEQRLHAIVVETEAQAVQAIDMLQRKRAGRAQFLPMDGIRHLYPVNMSKEKGVVGIAAKLVRCENRFRPLIDTLLGRVIVCEDVATGQRMVRRALGSVVTLDGTFIEANGVISGGATGAEEGQFSRQNELDDLPARITELKKRTEISANQLNAGRQTIDQLAARANEADASYESLRRQTAQATAGLQKERDRLHRMRRDMDGIRSRQREAIREREQRERQAGAAAEQARQMRQRRDERRAAVPALEDELRAALARRDESLRAVSEAGSLLASIEGERKALHALREQHERSLQRLGGQINERRVRARNHEQDAAAIEERLAKLALELAEVEAAQASFGEDGGAPDQDELRRLETHERTVQDDLNTAQASLLSAQRRRLELEAEVSRWSESLSNLRMEMEREGMAPDRTGNVVSMEQAMATDPMFDPSVPASLQGAAAVNLEETRLRIEELRRRIRRLGTINEEAPEDYRETRERYDYLKEQMADLDEAQNQLRAAIAELNEEVKTRFIAAFAVVNKSFTEYFQAFFGGGTAQLLMTNPENPAETGIDIEASPPGKRIRSLTLLSGGERSLTAVALLFALLTVNPAPFCVLDEVDAALDEANVGRFIQSLRKLSEKTQFIMVTHNRRSVEVANNIYGVSMNQDGVSKVLSLRLDDLPES